MKKILSVLLCTVLLVALVGCGGYTDAYNQKLYDFQMEALTGGATAEKTCNMVYDIWKDAIYEDDNAETREYTQGEYGFRDFNGALSSYFASDEYASDMKSLEENQVNVDKMFRELKNPPRGCEDGYEIAEELFAEKPLAKAEFKEELKKQGVPTAIEVEYVKPTRSDKVQKIKTDKGIEIIIPVDYMNTKEFVEFKNQPDGTISIQLKNITHITSK